MIEVIARPARPGKFDAVVNGEVLARSTATPLFSAARALSAAGHGDDVDLVLKHFGSDVVSIRSTIGKSRAISVVDSRTTGLQVRWFSHWGSGDDETAASGEPSATELEFGQ